MAVLPVSNQEQYDDLVNDNYDNENIMLFSTEDEVLTMLAEGYKGTYNAKRMGCDDPVAKRNKDTGYPSNKKRRRLKAKVVYQQAGIYFTLLAKGKTQRKRFGIWFRHYDGWVRLNYDYGFDIRCDDSEYNFFNPTINSSQGKASVRPYEGIKRLSSYFLKAEIVSSNGSTGLEIEWPENL